MSASASKQNFYLVVNLKESRKYILYNNVHLLLILLNIIIISTTPIYKLWFVLKPTVIYTLYIYIYYNIK